MEKTFDTSNFEIDKPLPIGKYKISDWSNERWIRWIDKPWTNLNDSSDEDKKAKGTKNCVIKWKLKSKDYKKCWKASQIENKINYLDKKKTDADSANEDQRTLKK